MGMPSDENLIIDAATLETSYQTSGVTIAKGIEVRSDDQLTLIVLYDKGTSETGNICEVEVSFSPDNTNYAIYGDWADGGSGQMTYTPQYFNVAQDQYAIIPFELIPGRYMQVRTKEEGRDTNAGTVSIYLYRNKR